MSAPNDEQWGPTVTGRARRRGRRLLSAVVVLLVLAAALLAGGAAWANRQLPRVPVEGLAEGGSPLQVLVIGSDSRADLTDDERRALATGTADGERADTIFVMTVDSGRVATLALPRDLWVERCDGSSGRINAALEIGGPTCLVDTVHDVTGIRVHHVMVVTFGGFRDVVDAVGGVELCLPDPISDRDAGIDLPAGCQRLDGADALGYVRVRKIDDDFHRIERQKQFLRALAAEATRPSVALNPARAVPMAREAGGALLVDDSLGPVGLARLGWGLRGLARGQTTGHTAPVTPRTTSGGAYVLDLQVAEAERLFHRFRTGEILEEATAGTDDVDADEEPGSAPGR